MRYYRIDDKIEKLKFDNINSTMFEIKAFIQEGTSLIAYNPHHREAKTPVKIIGGVPKLSLQPQFRVDIPTGLFFSIPVKYHLRVSAYKKLGLDRGLTMLNGIELYDNDYTDELKITMINHSDTPVMIAHGETIALGVQNKVLDYTLDETNRKVAFKTFQKEEEIKETNEEE